MVALTRRIQHGLKISKHQASSKHPVPATLDPFTIESSSHRLARAGARVVGALHCGPGLGVWDVLSATHNTFQAQPNLSVGLFPGPLCCTARAYHDIGVLPAAAHPVL